MRIAINQQVVELESRKIDKNQRKLKQTIPIQLCSFGRSVLVHTVYTSVLWNEINFNIRGDYFRRR